MMANIGKRIKEKREAIGMTQEELAIALGYKNKSTIAKIENGTNDIVQSKVVEFANALSTTVPYLMSWDEEDLTQITPVESFGLNILGTDFTITSSEIEHIKKYRSLDSYGQETVSYLLDRETARVKEIAKQEKRIIKLKTETHTSEKEQTLLKKPHLIPRASHERTDLKVTKEMKDFDDAFFDE
jgi:transcriptional regulator with XRE-family HTH domain